MKFRHVKLHDLEFDLQAVTTESGRTYTTPTGNRYPSITTVLSAHNKQAIQEWRERVGEEEANKISGMASRRGEALHLACEQYILNELNEFKIKTMMPNIKQLFLQLRPFLDKHIGDVYAVEQPLYSDVLKVAGRCDLIAQWDKKLSIIDHKTSSKFKLEENIENYFMQCSAYAEMFEEITHLKIDQIVVVIAVEGENSPQIFVKDKKHYLPKLKDYIRLHHESLHKQI